MYLKVVTSSVTTTLSIRVSSTIVTLVICSKEKYLTNAYPLENGPAIHQHVNVRRVGSSQFSY